ncbi:MAG: hypothetical protein LBT23_06565 [Synergistaceae bacterium]|nr:hypothetical protein [Synergistaceae bacterium]
MKYRFLGKIGFSRVKGIARVAVLIAALCVIGVGTAGATDVNVSQLLTFNLDVSSMGWVSPITVNANTSYIDTPLSLIIPSLWEVRWQVPFEGSSPSPMITISGTGSFEVVSGGSVSNTGTDVAISSTNTPITISGGRISAQGDNAINTVSDVTVSGGTVIAGGTNHIAINATGASSAVSVTGGIIEATGSSGSAIKATGASSTVSVSSGTIKATNTNGKAIDKVAGSVPTINGSANIFTSGSDSTLDSLVTSGLLFKGNSGTVYGTSVVTLNESLSIPSGGTLTVPSGAKLRIPLGVTLTVPRTSPPTTLYVDTTGIVDGNGSVTGSGTYAGSGTIMGTPASDYSPGTSIGGGGSGGGCSAGFGAIPLLLAAALAFRKRRA